MGTAVNASYGKADWVYPRPYPVGDWAGDSLPRAHPDQPGTDTRQIGGRRSQDGLPFSGEHPPSVGDQSIACASEEGSGAEVIIIRKDGDGNLELCEGRSWGQTGSETMADSSYFGLGGEQIPSSDPNGNSRRALSRQRAIGFTRYFVDVLLGLAIGFGLWNAFVVPQVPAKMPHFPIGLAVSGPTDTSTPN